MKKVWLVVLVLEVSVVFRVDIYIDTEPVRLVVLKR